VKQPSALLSKTRLTLGAALLALGLLIMNAEGLVVLVNEARSPKELRSAESWCYQLFAIDLKTLTKASCDMLVVDAADDARATFSSKALKQLRMDPTGSRRTVLAYLNIGEAELYRHYWRSAWMTSPPPWIVGRNQAWRGNFRVRYWAREWQDIIYSGPQSYLEAILDAGFDGVYLDNVDTYHELEAENPQAKAQMIAFVTAIAQAARAKRPRFKIVVQNAEELLAEPEYLAALDAIAKEDLLFGIQGDGVRNRPDDIGHSIGYLEIARRQDKPVFVVEYLEPAAAAAARDELRRHGFIPYFAERLLDRAPRDPAASRVPSRCGNSN
jgi:cysteinyl-tRNA synthetase